MSKKFLQLLVFGLFAGFLALFAGSAVFAATLFSDDFETYSIGNINGQGGWVSGAADYEVSAGQVFSGTKGLYAPYSESYLYKNVAEIQEDGELNFYIYLNTIPNGNYMDRMRLRLMTTDETMSDQPDTVIWCAGGACEVQVYNHTTGYVKYADISTQTWHSIKMEWSLIENGTRISMDGLAPTVWDWRDSNFYGKNLRGGYGFLEIRSFGSTYFDTFGAGAPPPDPVNIVSPASGSTVDAEFTMTATYSGASGYDRLMVLFEDWDASSTCPTSTDPTYDYEYANYFNYQSFPYFSPQFSTSSGTTTIAVADLTAHTFKCVRCYFINETSGAISLPQCPQYTLTVGTTISPSGYPPSAYFPIQSWPAYYASSTDKWATSTALFSSWADTLQPMTLWIGNLALSFKEMFNASTSEAAGRQYGEAIPTARGYLSIVNNFFAGLPVGEIYVFYLLTALVVIVFKMISAIIHLIKP
jgi:hypothetical protein